MDDAPRGTLNAAHLQRALDEAQRELGAARRDLDNLRGLVVGIGQAFVPEALVGAAGDQPHTYKKLLTAEIAHLIINAAAERARRFAAFTDGLTTTERERVIRRLVAANPGEWTDDSALAPLQAELANERALRREAEERTRNAETDARDLRAQLETAWRERATAQTELSELRQQLKQLTAARTPGLPAPDAVPVAPTPVASPPLVQPPAMDAGQVVAPKIAPVTSSVAAVAPRQPAPTPPMINLSNGADPLAVIEAEWRAGARQLITLLATRGLCERPRLARILATECGVGDGQPNHLRVNRAFEDSEKAGLIEVVKPRSEIGIGRAPHLIRLSEIGRIAATQLLGVNPAPSELDRLLKAHDTPEHVVLILGTRDALLERFPEPLERVDIFPVAVGLEGGKRYEADVEVQLQSGGVMYVECERATPKNRDQRMDKWGKYFKVTGGRFFVVTPDPKAMSEIGSEITEWHFRHRGNVRLRMTNLHEVLSGKADQFWKLEREMQ